MAAGSGGKRGDCIMLASKLNANISGVFTFPTIFGKLDWLRPLRAAKSLVGKNATLVKT